MASFLPFCRDALVAPFKPGGPPGGIAYTISAASQHNIIAVFSRAMRPGAASGASRTDDLLLILVPPETRPQLHVWPLHCSMHCVFAC